MSDVYTWDSNEFSVTLGDISVESGRGAGTFFSLEPLAEDWTDVVGADGEVTRSKVNNGGATVKLSVMRSSQAHKDLYALRALDLASTNGSGVFPFQARDRSNGLRFEAAKAWIKKAPSETAAREAAEAEWELRVGRYTVTDETAGV